MKPFSPFRDLSDWTPELLESVLEASGIQLPGRISKLSARSQRSSWSRLHRLQLDFEAEASPTDVPDLILKVSRGPRNPFGARELKLYHFAKEKPETKLPIPRAFDLGFDPATQSSHLLLEDLSQTHRTGFETPLEEISPLKVGEAIARFQAPFSSPTGLAEFGLAPDSRAKFEAFFEHCRGGLSACLEDLAGEGLGSLRAPLCQALDGAPELFLARLSDSRGISLLHGDLNPGNVLYPRSQPGAILFLDRQPFSWSLEAWVGAHDLGVYGFLHLEKARRAKILPELLEGYTRGLESRGVPVSQELIQADLKLSALACLHQAIEWGRDPRERKRMRWLWIQEVQNCLDFLSLS